MTELVIGKFEVNGFKGVLPCPIESNHSLNGTKESLIDAIKRAINSVIGQNEIIKLYYIPKPTGNFNKIADFDMQNCFVELNFDTSIICDNIRISEPFCQPNTGVNIIRPKEFKKSLYQFTFYHIDDGIFGKYSDIINNKYSLEEDFSRYKPCCNINLYRFLKHSYILLSLICYLTKAFLTYTLVDVACNKEKNSTGCPGISWRYEWIFWLTISMPSLILFVYFYKFLRVYRILGGYCWVRMFKWCKNKCSCQKSEEIPNNIHNKSHSSLIGLNSKQRKTMYEKLNVVMSLPVYIYRVVNGDPK